MALKDQIRQFKRPGDTVEAWGLTLGIRAFTLKEGAEIAALGNEDLSADRVHFEILRRGLYDPETEESVFSPDDFEIVAGLEAASVVEVSNRILARSGMSATAVTETKKD